MRQRARGRRCRPRAASARRASRRALALAAAGVEATVRVAECAIPESITASSRSDGQRQPLPRTSHACRGTARCRPSEARRHLVHDADARADEVVLGAVCEQASATSSSASACAARSARKRLTASRRSKRGPAPIGTADAIAASKPPMRCPAAASACVHPCT
jgi:hypothetical protein